MSAPSALWAGDLLLPSPAWLTAPSTTIRLGWTGTQILSNQPVAVFSNASGSAVPFGPVTLGDSKLRGGLAAPASPVWIGINGDSCPIKGENYLEGSMNTQFVLRKNSRYPVTLSIPVNLSLAEEEYYFGPHYGYISTGLNARVPLAFMPTRGGKWTAGLGADVCYFGSKAAEVLDSIGLQMPKLSATLAIEF